MHGRVRLLLEIANFWLSSALDENCASRSRHLSPLSNNTFVHSICLTDMVLRPFRLNFEHRFSGYLTWGTIDVILYCLSHIQFGNFCINNIVNLSSNPPIQQVWIDDRRWSTRGYSRYLSMKEMQTKAIAPMLCGTFRPHNILRSCRTDNGVWLPPIFHVNAQSVSSVLC